MKNMYEGMFIFPKALQEEALEQVTGAVRADIEKAGGVVKSTTRLGRRPFARLLGKQDAGHYVVFAFELEGGQVSPLLNRLKLNESILRMQVVRAEAPSEAVAPAGEKS